MGFFDIDYNKKLWEGLPVDERTPVRYAWLKTLIAPAVWVYNLFKTNRDNNLYDLAHNGQVCYLQAVLNDTFDPVSRRITIGNPQYDDPVYLYLDLELKPVFIDLDSEIGGGAIPNPVPEPAYIDSELYGLTGVQFIIHVPIGLVYDVARMKALIDKYRLVSKNNYTIVSP